MTCPPSMLIKRREKGYALHNFYTFSILIIKLDLHTNGMNLGIQMLKRCQSTLGSWRTGKCYWWKSRGGCCLLPPHRDRGMPKVISVFNTPSPNLLHWCRDTTLSGYFCSTFLSCVQFHRSKIKIDCPFLALVFQIIGHRVHFKDTLSSLQKRQKESN